MSALARRTARLRALLVRAEPLTAAGRPLRYRRIFLLPTAAGLGFTGMLLVMWLAAVNYGNSMAHALTFLLLALGLVFTLHAFRNLLGLEVRAAAPAPVFAGEPAEFPLQLHNRGRQPRSAVCLHYGGELQGCVEVPAGATATLTLRVPTQRRGRLLPSALSLETRYPGGLVRAWSWLRPTVAGLVYPQPESGAVPPPASSGNGRGGTQGAGDEDFHGLREYRPGDSLRRLDWRAVAREQPPQTKLYAGSGASSLWLDWHTLPTLPVEARLARLCRWLLDAEAAGRRYGLRLPGEELPPARGEAHLQACLRALALYPG